jgi:hypothetical protein
MFITNYQPVLGNILEEQRPQTTPWQTPETLQGMIVQYF